MLILNQWKDAIVNIDNMSRVYIEKSIVYTENDIERYTLGSYKSNIRAAEVLMEIFRATNRYEMPVE